MLYPVKVMTAALAAESLASTISAPTSNSNIGDSFGCSITLPYHNEQISIGSTVLISWVVEPNALTDHSDVEVDLLQEAKGHDNVIGKIKSKISSDTRSIAWYIDDAVPIDNTYYIRISSQSSMKCYGPSFTIRKFHGDDMTKMAKNQSNQKSSMVIPAGDPQENHQITNQNAMASSSHSMDSNLTNLVAGLLVFGAFLWV
ncbi:hypothetical protein NQZ79_g1129 [Umbelopsis isabellina]|nr:hypothetical protein NQZ79_g1129 [Umbelopsis isabellina]